MARFTLVLLLAALAGALLASPGASTAASVVSTVHKKDTTYTLTESPGFGIGNGLTDPQVQYKSYPEMAYNNSYHVQAVSYPLYAAMKAAVTPCVAMIAKCQSNKAACLAAQSFCNAALVAPYAASGLNVYDVREACKHPPLCYDFSRVERFLRLEHTRAQLHVDPRAAKWEACNMAVHAGFAYDWMKNFHQLVVPMLEAGVKGLVYAGDADFIVNWLGCKAWTVALEWSKGAQFVAAADQPWVVDGAAAGEAFTLGEKQGAAMWGGAAEQEDVVAVM
ncbi:hypothetical protein PybrP1_007511 [[Pythium] brassicae (nom. inval.)]|nr:hypothetical protein PybrP1_007511 [[Pythium] brassicae (nom. inval.)]